MRPLAILVAGDPLDSARALRGSYPDMIRRAVGDAWSGEWLEVECRAGGPLPELAATAGVVITGSSASVTERAPWILATEAALRRAVAADVPVLGICFGHQLLGQALGGRVEQNPRGRQIGTLEVTVLESTAVVGERGSYAANVSHRDVVVELPPGARVLARTERDPHAALHFGGRVWGVQFHPEFDLVTVRAYIVERRQILRDEGLDPEALLARTTEAEGARAVLPRFVAAHCRAGSAA